MLRVHPISNNKPVSIGFIGTSCVSAQNSCGKSPNLRRLPPIPVRGAPSPSSIGRHSPDRTLYSVGRHWRAIRGNPELSLCSLLTHGTPVPRGSWRQLLQNTDGNSSMLPPRVRGMPKVWVASSGRGTRIVNLGLSLFLKDSGALEPLILSIKFANSCGNG